MATRLAPGHDGRRRDRVHKSAVLSFPPESATAIRSPSCTSRFSRMVAATRDSISDKMGGAEVTDGLALEYYRRAAAACTYGTLIGRR